MNRCTICCFHPDGSEPRAAVFVGEIYGQRLPTLVMMGLLQPYLVIPTVCGMGEADFEEFHDNEAVPLCAVSGVFAM